MNYPKKMMRAGFLSLMFAASVSAQTLVEYTFGTGNTASNVTTSSATTTGSNVVAGSVFTKGAGINNFTLTSATGAPIGRSLFVTADKVDEGISAASTDWVGFTVSATSGNVLNLSDLSFYYAYTNTNGTITSSATFDVRSSLDGYATPLAVYNPSVVNSTTPSWTLANIDLSAPEYQGLSSISFRIILGDDGVGTSNTQLRLDTVNLSGVATVIPEPSAYGLLAGAGMLVVAFARRRMR